MLLAVQHRSLSHMEAKTQKCRCQESKQLLLLLNAQVCLPVFIVLTRFLCMQLDLQVLLQVLFLCAK